MKLTKLTTFPAGSSIPIHDLDEDRLGELQTALTKLGYPLGDIDGLYGPKTRNAWAECVEDFKLGDPLTIDAGDVAKLQGILDQVTPIDAQHDFSTKEGTIAAIKSECANQGLGIKTQIAYVLATVDHETAHRFQPVSEAFWLKDPDTYLRTHLPSSRYYPYYGRGYVQLTWKNNYEKYAQLLGLDLVNHPQLASKPEVALFVLVHGFKTGTFSGRKLSDYVDIHKTDFVNARRCINGLDKAQAIAEMARSYLATL